MASPNRISFRCFEVEQPIGLFYIGVMDAADLVSISYADIRRMEERDIEKYLGIQRTLNEARVRDIIKYVHTVDATFPTGVILAINGDHAEYNHKLQAMAIDRADSVAKIIDGQHRIAGLKHLKKKPFLVNVTIFIDMDIEDQSLVFSTINLQQTKVTKSLAYDLYENAKSRSPQKTLHNAARVLNQSEGSPFHEKIKILGVATAGKTTETITQATFIEGFLGYLTSDALGDRDAIKRHERLKRTELPDDKRVLRNLFIDEKDTDIVVLIWNYFTAVQRRWPGAWRYKEAGNILNRTTGFNALARLFPTLYRRHHEPATVPTIEFFETLFTRVPLRDEDFSPDNYPPGGSGSSKLYKEMLGYVGPSSIVQ